MVDTGNLERDLPVGFAKLVNRVSAAIIAIASLWLCMWFYTIRFNEPYQALMIIIALLAILILRGPNGNDIYIRQPVTAKLASVAVGWLLLCAILAVFGYATKSSTMYSRKLLFTWFIVTPPLIVLAQVAIERAVSRLALSAKHSRPVVIAGMNELGLRLAEKIRSAPHLGMSLAGFFDDRSIDRLGAVHSEQLLGNLKDIPEYLKTSGADIIFIALPMRNIERVSLLVDELHDTTTSIYYVPDIFVFDLIQCRTDEIDGVPVIALCETPFYGTRGVVKRVSDIAIASFLILLLAPLLLLISLCIKLTTRGSVIFRQRRYGLDGREIVVYKFRSMNVSEDNEDVRQTTRFDSRVTRIGAFLRKYSLDELPQLLNVLQGTMSMVGPRPHAVIHNEEYRRLIKGYMIRHMVTPGITGLAQVSGLRGETSCVEDMRRRVECDLNYLRNWSLGLDLKIIFKTALIVLRDKKAY
ncbi:MAG: undecaprenyl-phosphate glucose phosphotransferase [Gammaproteobacteria bacterium]|nr:undecaprenyl-phosphate glucose phosphotransferase [Gammaproteobacteria bacterium]MDH4316173.1 undecaprenyl-phosphate glucose phosphotransferase [Gammaproteobacteria bacterium]